MTPAVTEILVGMGAAGLAQGVSEILKLGHGILDITKGLISAQNAEYRANLAEESKTADAAAKRFPFWMSGTIAITIIMSAFVLVHINGWLDITTSIVSYIKPWLNLGILRFGGGAKVVEAQGVVIFPEFWESVRFVIGSVLGLVGLRTGKKLWR